MSETAWKLWWIGIAVLGLFAGNMAAPQHAAAAEATKSTEQIYFERIIASVEPGLAGSPDRLPLYLQLFQRQLINDTRLFPCRIEVEWTADRPIVLTGFLGFNENRTALQKLLEYLGFNHIDDRIEVLPSKDLGEEKFGFIRTPHSFSHHEPTDRSEVLTDCLLATPVYLLKEVDGYFLCHALEGYVGYVDAKDLYRVNAQRFTRYQSGPHVRMRQNHTTETGLRLPMGTRLKLLQREPGRIIVSLPDGNQASVPNDSCHVDNATPNPKIASVIRAAEELLGTKYVWGGNTSDGIDCSGLVQTAFATVGINLARDSNQQVLAGRLVATRGHRDGLRPGDTLYFLGEHGKVRHTALYLGDNRYIEAVRPVVRYSSFDPANAQYSKRGDAAFCFAKRIIE